MQRATVKYRRYVMLAKRKKSLLAAQLERFMQQYGRKATKGWDPNNRGYDRKIEEKIKRLAPEELGFVIRRRCGACPALFKTDEREMMTCLLLNVGFGSGQTVITPRFAACHAGSAGWSRPKSVMQSHLGHILALLHLNLMETISRAWELFHSHTKNSIL